MSLLSTRLNRSAVRCRFALAFGIVLVTAATPARGQCDPYSMTKLTASDAAANDLFGRSVAVSGETAVVGAIWDNQGGGFDIGSAYVFVRSNGVWTQQGELTALDAALDDSFGSSVAVSGDTAVVGAENDDHAGGSNAGSAYVFVRSNGVWTQQAKLTALDAAIENSFGYSVSVSGDTAVVGAYRNDTSGNNAGAAYVFKRNGTVWTQQAKLTAADAAASDTFGISVAVSGDTAVVGAHQDTNAGGSSAGSAYVFIRIGTVWVQLAKLTASDAAANDIFGFSVALSGDTAVVGAMGHDNGCTSQTNNSGAAYVFVGSEGVWSQLAKLTASGLGPQEEFGRSVAISGDMVVVGKHYDDNAGGIDAGAAYVFVRTDGIWTERAKLTASDGAAQDDFGNSVAVANDTVLVGAQYNDHAGLNAGAAYVFQDVRCDFDGDGVTDMLDICPNSAPGMSVDCAGRPLRDCNLDCAVDSLDIQCIVDEMLNQ